MSIGKNIRSLREEKGFTQEKLAEKLNVSFQAVSSWERDEYKPDLDNLMKLAEILDVSLSAIAEEKGRVFKTRYAIYNWEHMKTYVKTTAKNFKMTDTLKAVDFAVEAHEGQKRKKSDTPYIYHPLNMACHALAMGIKEDALIAAILLHDVIEDCQKTVNDLPVGEDVREIVLLVTHEKAEGKDRDKIMEKYYEGIVANPKAALVKCIDRCNNLTTISWGLSRNRIYRMITETEKYYPELLKSIKSTMEYNDAAYLLQYHIESMLDIYKRLM
ncbi:MAG: XRE family transcriptional regulator [Johnsonella sp.]|nr:XRE family transcriptional regulator [Johnsonella sp.]